MMLQAATIAEVGSCATFVRLSSAPVYTALFPLDSSP